jgi:hypothetical protein
MTLSESVLKIIQGIPVFSSGIFLAFLDFLTVLRSRSPLAHFIRVTINTFLFIAFKKKMAIKNSTHIDTGLLPEEGD